MNPYRTVPWPPPAPLESERTKRLHAVAGGLAVAGGVVRLAAYFLPWVVATIASQFADVRFSGMDVLGTPVFSVGYSAATIVIGVLYLAGRRETLSTWLFWLGVSAAVVFVFQYSSTLNDMQDARAAFEARGLQVSLRLGIGIFVEAAGAALVLASGLVAALAKRTRAESGPPAATAP